MRGKPWRKRPKPRKLRSREKLEKMRNIKGEYSEWYCLLSMISNLILMTERGLTRRRGFLTWKRITKS